MIYEDYFNYLRGQIRELPAAPPSLDEALAMGGQLRTAPPEGALDRFTGQVNRSISALGAPVDLVASLLGIHDPFMGSQSISRGMEAIGAPVANRPPETVPEAVGSGIGSAASMLVPFSKGAQAMGMGRGMLGDIGKTISEPFLTHPVSTVGLELAAGAGAGGGGQVAEELGAPRGAGEILGGIAGDFLRAAVTGGSEAVAGLAHTITREIKIAMFCAGAANLEALHQTPLYPA